MPGTGSPPARERPRDEASTQRVARLHTGAGSTIGEVCRFAHHAGCACSFHAPALLPSISYGELQSRIVMPPAPTSRRGTYQDHRRLHHTRTR